MVAAHELTFGIELEFIALVPETMQNGIHDEIIKILRRKGIRAGNKTYDGGGLFEDEGTDKNDSDALATASNNNTYNFWKLAGETVMLTETEVKARPQGWANKPFELISRKFNFVRDDWRTEIDTALKCLQEVEGWGVRFVTNKTTGLHVHVGNAGRKIPLRAAKNVYQIATAFEKIIDELHATQRIQLPEDLNKHCWTAPPCFFHMYRPDLDGPSGNVLHRIANIESTETYNELGQKFSIKAADKKLNTLYDYNGHNSAYNFDNLYRNTLRGINRRLDVKGTIEFRQKAGTLDAVEMKAWICFVVGLVEFCTNATPEQMIFLCLRCTEEDFRLEDLLKALGCPQDVSEYYVSGSRSIVVGFPHNPLRPSFVDPSLAFLLHLLETSAMETVEPANVKAVIKSKQEKNLYGIDEEQDLWIVQEAVTAELQAKKRDMWRGADSKTPRDTSQGLGLSKAIEEVFRSYANKY